mmetsp:Transcript_4984/g.11659  ORF Transcript_4984/g.11659 Transcript_4984/m.11659 type:complete len:632 (-) Transcript_4984:37-1932(-)
MRVLPAIIATAAAAGTRVWVPINVGDSVKYFDPESQEMRAETPTDGELAPAVDFIQHQHHRHHHHHHNGNSVEVTNTVVENTVVTGSEGDATSGAVQGAEGTDQSNVGAATSVAANAVGVEESDAKSCFPKCTWNCTHPVCNQDCAPECEQPKCQTRCPKPDYSKCAIDCSTPACSVFCPEKHCHQNSTEKCSSPKCSTQCGRPICSLKCKEHVPCDNVCHAPKCSWNCRNPKACKKPECRLMCEKPLGCAQSFELPPLSPSLTVQQQFNAERAKWVVYEWGQCGTKCGESTQTRKVVCSTGQDHECVFAPKPPTSQKCKGMEGCNKWETGFWSECSTMCGSGVQTRKVFCNNDDKAECLGERPTAQKKCTDDGPHCKQCHVTLFGGPYFNKWSATFAPGEYDNEALLAHGVKCEEVSSIKVHGRCCSARVFQYGDFNQANKGWATTLRHGPYDVDALEDAGVQDNDVSSMVVRFRENCQVARPRPGSEGAGAGESASWKGKRGSRGARSGGRGGGESGGLGGDSAGGVSGGDDEAWRDEVNRNRNPGSPGTTSEMAARRFGGSGIDGVDGDAARDIGNGDLGDSPGQVGNGGLAVPGQRKPDPEYPWWFWLLIAGLLGACALMAYVMMKG